MLLNTLGKLFSAAVFTLWFSFAQNALAAKSKGLADQKRIDKIASLFTGKKTIKLEVEKTVISELLQKTTTSEGEIYLGQGRLRWEVTSPEKSLIVFDGSTLWTEQPAFDAESKPIVTKSKINKNQKDQDLLKLLTGEKWSKYLDVKDRKKEDAVETVMFAPKSKSSDLKEFSFVVTKNKLSDIRYTDEVGNQTTLKIKKIEALKKPDAQLFKYKAPANAQVNEL